MRSLGMLPMVFALLATANLNTTLAADSKNTASEYAVKAAYIYNILRFVKWHERSQLSHTETLNVCLTNDNLHKQSLAPIEKKRIKDKQIQLKSMARLTQSEDCHLIFIDKAKTDITELTQQLKHDDTILLGNNIDFVRHGGLFGFHITDNKVKLAANRKSIEKSRLKISSLLIEACQLIGEDQ